MKKITNRVISNMVRTGVLTKGNFVLTNNYLVVPAKDARNVYNYLYKKGYATSAENKYFRGEHQISVLTINER